MPPNSTVKISVATNFRRTASGRAVRKEIKVPVGEGGPLPPWDIDDPNASHFEARVEGIPALVKPGAEGQNQKPSGRERFVPPTFVSMNEPKEHDDDIPEGES